jgi:cytochrome P450
MLDYLVQHPGDKTLDGLRRIAINVMGHTGYGQGQPWSSDFQKASDEARSGKAAYFKTLSMIVDQIIEAAFLPRKLMKMPFMPLSLQLLGQGLENMPGYVKEILDRERQAAKEGSGPRDNLLSMLVQMSDKEKSQGASGLSLTEDEISGNLFVFSVAGFDTTANTMAYAVTLLAAHPEWQDWIREELHVLDRDASRWRYVESFPKCQRLLAVMVCIALP